MSLCIWLLLGLGYAVMSWYSDYLVDNDKTGYYKKMRD